MNTDNYVDMWTPQSTSPARQLIQAFKIIILIRGHHLLCSACLEESKQSKNGFEQSKQ
jgi:hypothetical protein